MKVVKPENSTKFFNEIKNGEAFKYNDEVHMAIDEILLYGDTEINAINLETAELLYIGYAVEVEPLPEAKIVY